jgi:predicted ATPase
MDHQLRFRVQDFRALRRFEWSPEGVSLLCGANGVGKSTVLGAVAFLRDFLLRGRALALQHAGGTSSFRHHAADPSAMVVFEVARGDVRWQVEFPVDGAAVASQYGETVLLGEKVELSAPAWQNDWLIGSQRRLREDERSGLRYLLDVGGAPAALSEFAEALRNIRVYPRVDVGDFLLDEEKDRDDQDLHPSGKNMVPVLRNWNAAPRRFRDQFQWVRSQIAAAFPDLIESIEFEPRGEVAFFPRGAGPDDGIPLKFAADGLLKGLFLLTAVAGARDRALVAIDEIENHLHPFAIRSLLRSIRGIAEERGIAVVLTSHSPVVMNTFRDEPDRLFVVEPTAEVNPGVLSQQHDEDWLAQFALGDLYDRLKFGAPRLPSRDAASE